VTIDVQVDYPSYLQTLADFEAYLADQFEALNNTERGRRFAEAALMILPHMPHGDKYSGYALNSKRSHTLA
jgi:hypothetical protein